MTGSSARIHSPLQQKFNSRSAIVRASLGRILGRNNVLWRQGQESSCDEMPWPGILPRHFEIEHSHLNGFQDGPLFGGYGTPIFLYSKGQEIISIKPSQQFSESPRQSSR
jgi:hypothetical protein